MKGVMTDSNHIHGRDVLIRAGRRALPGLLVVPARARSIVIFAHGSGSGRLSRRNSLVADALNRAGLATLLFDLLSEEEARQRQNTFDIPLLASRLRAATAWAHVGEETSSLAVGYFGASTGAAAALVAASEERGITAVVSRGGRPDLAREFLPHVSAPTLLIVGGKDDDVLRVNQDALEAMHCTREIAVVSGASHLFEESGTLEQAAQLATQWFSKYLILPMEPSDVH